MALNFPSSPSNGQVYTDDNNISWQFDGVKWDVTKSQAYKLFNGVKAQLSTNFALTDTVTAISWDDIEYDIGDYHETNTPTRLIIRSAGFYRINAAVTTSSSGAAFTVEIKKNGTTTLSSATISVNQYVNYDEILELTTNDYIEVCVSDSISSGAVVASGSYFEINKVGTTVGTAAEIFSGARAKIDSTYATNATPTAIPWDSVAFNQNANSAGDQYWSSGNSTKLTIGTTSYYRIKAVVLTNTYDSYTLTLRKNGTTSLATIDIGALNTVQLDEIYQLNTSDYVELLINDSGGTGGLLVGTYFEILRIGNV